MSTFIFNAKPEVKEFTMDLSQVTGTYDLATASNDLLITNIGMYVTTVGLTITSVNLVTNDSSSFVVLNATDGAVANLLLGKNLATTWNQSQPIMLRSGKKLQYTIVGLTGSGTIKVNIVYLPIISGATLS